MARTVSDAIVERLRQWGVRTIFGYPGDGINGVFMALERAEGHPKFVQARHEETAAFMACGHAKFTGELGVCLATSGPGAVHLLNGLYDAKLDHQPVLAIVGQQPRYALGGSSQQEVDLLSLFKDVAGEYVHMVLSPAQVPALVDRAARIALDRRAVTCLILPTDVQEAKAVDKVPHKIKYQPGGVGYSPPRVVPPEAELRRAAAVLNAGGRVAMLVGQGARGAADELIEAADLLGAPVAKALLGKDVLPDDLPFVTGSIGLLGTRPSWDMMMACDTLLMVGSSFPYWNFLPKPGQAHGVQIDIDGTMIGIRYPMEVNLIGDAREALRALIPLLHRKKDRSWRQRIEAEVVEWWRVLEARAMMEAKPLNPQRVFWELSPRLPDGAILTCDSGSSANWYARDIRMRRGMRGSLSGTLATMGPGVPYAIAAKMAYPDRPVIALVGDGAMQMNGMAELITIKHYHREWPDQRLLVCVLRNRDLNQVTWEQRAMEGAPKFPASQDVPDVSYALFAESIGLRGMVMDGPSKVGPVWDEALRSSVPVVIDAVTDPDTPPLPPHITLEQARAFARAIAGGDPDATGIVQQSLLEKVADIFHGDRRG